MSRFATAFLIFASAAGWAQVQSTPTSRWPSDFHVSGNLFARLLPYEVEFDPLTNGFLQIVYDLPECEGIPEDEKFSKFCAFPIIEGMPLLYLERTNQSHTELTTQELADGAYKAFQTLVEPWASWSADQERVLREAMYVQAARHILYQARTDEEWRAYIRENAASWSTERKKILLSMIGLDMSNHYDRDRMIVGHPAARGSVSLLTLFDAQRDDFDAGVCRDIAAGLGLIAREMGFEDTYVIGYQNTAGHHATLVMADPDHPGRLIKLNYEEISSARSELGPSSLVQDGEVTTRYRIFDPEGRMVGTVPTELRSLFAEGVGFSMSEVDYFARQTAPATGAIHVGEARARAHLFVGKLTNGSAVLGAARSGALGDEENGRVGARYAIGAAIHDNVQLFYGDHGRILQLFTDLRLRLNSDWVGDERFGARARATFLSFGSVTRSFTEDATVPSTENYLNLTLEAKGRSKDARTRYRSELTAQLAEGRTDVRSSGGIRPMLNTTYLSAGAERDLGRSLLLAGDAALGYRSYGFQARARLSLADSVAGHRIEVGYEGRLDEGASWAPGRARQASVLGEARVKGWGLGVEYRRLLEGEGDDQLRIGARKSIR